MEETVALCALEASVGLLRSFQRAPCGKGSASRIVLGGVYIETREYRAGTLYPLLYELEERKLVAGEWNSPNRRSRRVYKITEPGAKYKKNGFKGIDLLIRSSNSDSGA